MQQDNEFLTQYKQKVFGVAKAFDAFCTKYNLQYFALAGTCIGAIRHKGIIPWDDDMDFGMPRADYERFLKLAKTEMRADFDVISARTEKNYYNSIAKMCDAHTTLWEGAQCHCIIGAFIDIFPMDGLPNTTDKGRVAYFNKYLKIRNAAEGVSQISGIDALLSAIKHWDTKRMWRIYYNWKYRLLKRSNDMYSKCDDYLSKYTYENSEYVAYFGTFRGPKVISPKTCFSSYTYMPFEDFQLRIPIGYDEYLRRAYGDYMKLPPRNKRVSNHSHYFFDFEKRYTFDEVKAIMSKKK